MKEKLVFVGRTVAGGKEKDGSSRIAVFIPKKIKDEYKIKAGVAVKVTIEEVL